MTIVTYINKKNNTYKFAGPVHILQEIEEKNIMYNRNISTKEDNGYLDTHAPIFINKEVETIDEYLKTQNKLEKHLL